MPYTKRDLRLIHQHLASLLPPGAKPLTAEQILEVGELLAKTKTAIETARPMVERGRKILEWRLAKEFAPTLNEYAQWQRRSPWRVPKTREELRRQFAELLIAHPEADLVGAQTPRWIRGTRFTSAPKLVDEASLDSIGLKMPLDVLKRMGALVDDSRRWLFREARIVKCKRGETHVLLELFACAHEQVDDSEPPPGPAPADPRRFGPLTQAIVGESTGPGKEHRPRLPFGS